MEIVHAVMPQSYQDIIDHAHAIRGHLSMIQIDIMDGVFVKGTTWPFLVSDQPEGDEWELLQKQEEGLPLWDEIDYELDLMIAQPEKTLDQWIALGPKRITLHIETLADPVTTLERLQEIRTLIEIGLAISNDTPLETLMPHLEVIDYVQVMGIATIGVQGEEMDERSLDRIRALKQQFPHLIIQVDGGVNSDTIADFQEAGADRCVVGSALDIQDVSGSLEYLESSLV